MELSSIKESLRFASEVSWQVKDPASIIHAAFEGCKNVWRKTPVNADEHKEVCGRVLERVIASNQAHRSGDKGFAVLVTGYYNQALEFLRGPVEEERPLRPEYATARIEPTSRGVPETPSSERHGLDHVNAMIRGGIARK